ncbi:Type I restriction-modification system, restriction subunit R (EC [Bathymodiolus azoricus thioautotrophic gill symbiont]|uniref:Type I restriction-modification system, restriction subunit R (EC) n=2 Tax=Bathymodiolus azoricus thioautotrophic gill symbiont TaxID=235205 RepID=A0ACA8ZNA9_9GAMM|nr:HsdR family type I site-specific deoxyribonuclease [Bathymodiolus azoricus thioautotrophic gill symbiont]CAB5496410.1 Type I restriction-modification system, restriction subunit R (EC [Bathymodiolus azoricus thioautotrophic gill symbiont]
MKFTEAKLEQAFIELLGKEGFPHCLGNTIDRADDEVLIEEDLKNYLLARYKKEKLTEIEAKSIILQLKTLSSSDLYESNKKITGWLADGFPLKREDRTQKDIHIELIDYSALPKDGKDHNIYKFVNQLEIIGSEKRIPDGIIYINGLPVVVFEFKSAIREEATIHNAFEQLTIGYKRDIPELFKYNAFCVISDGVNNKAGSFFAPYEFYYAWRRVAGLAKDVDGIDSMFTLVQGMFNQNRLRDIIQNFIYIPDTSKKDEKIVCRYPQYYAARALYENIKKAEKPNGDGKGGTYFGATGSGKSFTMLYLTRLLMKSEHFESPTIVLITDRTDLDDQLSGQFTNAKSFIGDDNIKSVESRAELRTLMQGRKSGGVFLTTIHKFTEDTELLTERTNIICISDEAHRSQTNLDQKVKITSKGVKKTFGFARYLHDSLPNATFVGFTGTPIDATLDVFGKVVDSYTTAESVRDEITVGIVHEGRAATVVLHNSKLEEIEKYYEEAAKEGANEYQIEKSKKATATMNSILGDPKRLQALAKDFVEYYSKRISEGSSVKGKAMFVCSSRKIGYDFYKNIIALKPEWAEVRAAEEGTELTDKEKREIKPMERIKMIMTRGKDDPKEMYDLLGTKDHRKELDRQFKNEKSNFKIAIVVDMWLTGFDIPFLDSIYIDKPIRQHNLIQTISRVNRKFKGKNKGLVVDYIGIKKQMNLALAKYNKEDEGIFEDIQESLIVVRNHLDLLAKIFHKFDNSKYFSGATLEQLNALNMAAEYVQLTKELETRFMGLVKRLKMAYDICSGSDQLTQIERDYTHFYLAVRSIVFKLTKGSVPDTAQMNAKVREMIKGALESDGVQEIFKLGDEAQTEQDLFDEDYLAKIDKIKLPNTKIKLLQYLLAKAIGEIKKVNKVKGIDFSKKMQSLVEKYNERREDDVLRSEVYEEMAEHLTNLIWEVKKEFTAGVELGIDFEEKAFYDILKELCAKYDFKYPEDKLIALAKVVKDLVDAQAKFPDWNKREEIKSSLKAGLILLLDKHGYPPVERDEVYQDIFDQAENFKKNRVKDYV